MSYFTTREEADGLAQLMRTVALADDAYLTRHLPRLPVGFDVEKYPGFGNDAWGIVQRWTYADRRTAETFGGAFLWIPQIRDYIEEQARKRRPR